MTRLLLVFVLVLVASSVSAQTVERQIDLASLGWGNVSAERIDADGNPYTEEWLVSSTNPFCTEPICFVLNGAFHYRVVAVRAEGVCAGAWFQPTQTGTVTVTRSGVRDVLTVRESRWTQAPLLTEIRLDIPVCH